MLRPGIMRTLLITTSHIEKISKIGVADHGAADKDPTGGHKELPSDFGAHFGSFDNIDASLS